MFNPPRPAINDEIVRKAAKTFTDEEFTCLPDDIEQTDSINHLVKHYAEHKTGYELAKDLELMEGWEIDADTVSVLDDFDDYVWNELKVSEKEWVENNNIRPPFEIRTEVEYLFDKCWKTGVITGIYQHRPACYTIKENGWDDEKDGHVRNVVKWEHTRKIEMCSTMNRPRTECGCPDCGSSLTEYNE